MSLITACAAALASAPSLTAEQLDAQLAATQRSNLIEMGIVLVVFVAAIGAGMWYVFRQPKQPNDDYEGI